MSITSVLPGHKVTETDGEGKHRQRQSARHDKPREEQEPGKVVRPKAGASVGVPEGEKMIGRTIDIRA
jgi:hypothetical protein